MAAPPDRAPSPPVAAGADTRDVCGALDDALVAVARVRAPAFPRAEAAATIAAALESAYAALDVSEASARAAAQAELLKATRAAVALVDGARVDHEGPALATAVEGAGEAVAGHLARAQAALEQGAAARRSARLDRPRGTAAERASRDEPRPLALDRRVLRPAVGLGLLPPEITRPRVPRPSGEILAAAPGLPAAPPADEAMLDALVAEAEAALAAAEAEPSELPPPPPPPAAPGAAEEDVFDVALTPDAVLMDRARSFLEDLGMMSVMRQPDEGDAWPELAVVEARLLARVDAILACGEEVLPRLVALLDERPVPDAELTWALVFLFGCIAGEDAADQVARLARSAALENAAVFDATADALALVPNDGVERHLRRWLGAPDGPVLARLAVRALGRRGGLTRAEAAEALRGASPVLQREVAAALAGASERVDPGMLARLLRHPDPEVVAAALDAALLHLDPAGMAVARQLTVAGRAGHAAAGLHLALGAGARGLEVLERATLVDRSPALVEAAGWYGNVKLVPWLLDVLEAGGASAAAALHRITGAVLTDDDPAPAYRDEEHPFLVAAAPPPRPIDLTEDAAAWRRWWGEHGGRAAPARRWRHGHPWSPLDDLWEMEAPLASPRDRRLAHLELVARTGQPLAFDPRAFVATQRRQLEAWRAALSRGRGEGAWPTALER